MLKKIRKMSKQKAIGKEQEEILKAKDKTESLKAEKADTTVLMDERDSLQEEVKSLKEQLRTENIRYTELKTWKSQKICALTFKLNKAMRDKESIIEENQNLKRELQRLKNARRSGESDLEYQKSVPLDVLHVESVPFQDRCPLSNSEKELACPILSTAEDDEADKGSCELLSCSLVPDELAESSNAKKEVVQEQETENTMEKPCTGGEPREAEDIMDEEVNSVCSSDTLSTSQSSFTSDDQKRKVMAEFRRIQQELVDVKKNMKMVQVLNEQLSCDLQSLVDKKNSHPLTKTSLRMHKNGQNDYSQDITSKRENVLISASKTVKGDQGKTMQDASTETEEIDAGKSDSLGRKNYCELQSELIGNQERLEKTLLEGSCEFKSFVERSSDDIQKIHENVMGETRELGKMTKDMSDPLGELQNERVESVNLESLESPLQDEGSCGVKLIAEQSSNDFQKIHETVMGERKELEKATKDMSDHLCELQNEKIESGLERKSLKKVSRDESCEVKSVFECSSDDVEKGQVEMIGAIIQLEKEMKTPDEKPCEIESSLKSRNDNVKGRHDNVMTVSKQLEKATKELEELRTDNKEMKEKINKIASSSTVHEDFIRRTTQFTSLLLKEMREREQTIEKKLANTIPIESTAPPLGFAFMQNPISRPESAFFPATHVPVFAGQSNTGTKPLEQENRRFIRGKLGEHPFTQRHVGRIIEGAVLKKPMAPLAKEWRSTETLSARSSFGCTLGYRDYIQRHIVMSSNAIAKIRDPTPEELSARVIY